MCREVFFWKNTTSYFGINNYIFSIYSVSAKSNDKILRDLDLSDVDTITIESLPPGNKTKIEDRQQVSKLIDYFHSLKLKKDTAKNNDGINYRIYVNESKKFLFFHFWRTISLW